MSELLWCALFWLNGIWIGWFSCKVWGLNARLRVTTADREGSDA